MDTELREPIATIYTVPTEWDGSSFVSVNRREHPQWGDVVTVGVYSFKPDQVRRLIDALVEARGPQPWPSSKDATVENDQ
jgi:hypothetical protein